jgi:rhamnosyltransferase subunit B
MKRYRMERRAMQVLIVTLGTLGDLLPFLTIAKALTERGHEVTIGTSRAYESHITRLGIRFSPIPGKAVQLPAEDARFWDVNAIWRLGWEEALAPAMRPTYELVREAARRPPCVVIAHWAAFGARLAEEKLGVPLCTTYLSPDALSACDSSGTTASFWRELADGIFAPQLNAYRAELELDPIDHICSTWLHSSRGGLALFPEWFCARQSYWPAQIVTTGFVMSDESASPVALERVEEFLQAGSPPVVLTPGTGMPNARHFFQESLEACGSIGARAILLTPYHAQVPQRLPPWALHMDYVPLNRLLPRSSAIVHPGGIGTCAQAIRAAAPQLLAPIAVDQFDNAQRIQSLGLGSTIPMRDYEGRVVTQKLDELLSATADRDTHRHFAALCAHADPIGQICQLVEELL